MEYQQKNLTRSEYEEFLKVTAGEKPADLVLENVSYLDVFTNQFKKGNVAIAYGTFAGIGDYKGRVTIDMTGKTIVPGFIDGHIHIESTTVVPEIFAREALKHGTTAILTDPHEIANVMGVDGIKYMLEATENLPMDIYFMLPSCVPSCEFDESKSAIFARDMEQFYDNKRVFGIAELMDVKGVVSRRPDVMDKTYSAILNNKLIDGHAPTVTGQELMAYVAAGVLSDHECADMNEALEKMGLGLWIMIREGTAAQNLEALMDLCKEPYAVRCMFCTDDRHINDIMDEGHIDNIIRKAISLGAAPEVAFKMASCSAAVYFGLRDRGAISPGFRADFVVLDDVNTVAINSVYKSGQHVTDEYLDKECKSKIRKELEDAASDTFHLQPVTSDKLQNTKALPVMGLVDGQLYTTNEGEAEAIDVANDILKVAVIERHHNTGHIGLGFIKGYGLKSGAIATSVAHDSHNIIAVGTCEEDIAAAVNELCKIGGGMLVYDQGQVKASYALPVAGLMSKLPGNEAKQKIDQVRAAAESIGVNKGIDPFMTLSFTALPVIPELRITTHGMVDVSNWKLIR